MGIGVQPCCCGGFIAGLHCSGSCNSGTTPPELILTVPAGTFAWVGGATPCPGSQPANCAAWIEGTYLLEQTTGCLWPYSPPVAGACSPHPLPTCFSDTTHLWYADAGLRTVLGVPHVIMACRVELRSVPACITIEQGYWEKDLGVAPLDCRILQTPQTLALVRRAGTRCVPNLGSTLTLVVA